MSASCDIGSNSLLTNHPIT